MARLVIVLLCASRLAAAQGVVGGRVLQAGSTKPLACVDATLRRADGTAVAAAVTRADGSFEFPAPEAGLYSVWFSTLGMMDAVASLDSLDAKSDIEKAFAVLLTVSDSLVEKWEAAGSDARYPRTVPGRGSPRYPVTERSNRRNGNVVAGLVVTDQGLVDTVNTVILYATSRHFADAVMKALPDMRFVPAQSGGSARCTLLVFPFRFRVEGGRP